MTAPVSFIMPLTITASMITSSTAVTHSTTEPNWVSGTTYALDQVVFVSSVGRRFQCLIAGSSTITPQDDQTRWYDLGATSSITMFDSEVSTQSIADGTLTTVFKPGSFNAMFLAGLDGTSLTVTIKDAPGGAEVYSYTGSLDDSQPDDYYDYFFAPYRPVTDFLVTGLMPYASCEVTITITNTGSIAKCGMASLGDLVSLGGAALAGVTIEPKSYARITTDERGKTSIKKGKAARDLSISTVVDLVDVSDVANNLTQVLGVPCAWIGTDTTTLQAMRTFGLGNGKLTVNQTHATLSLTVQGMI